MMTKERKGIFPFAIMFAVASVLFLIATLYLGIDNEVKSVYFPYAETMMGGVIPNIEYPPFALVFLTIPGIFASTPDAYAAFFVMEVYLFFAVGLIFAGKIAKRFDMNPNIAMLAYTIMMLFMLQFVLYRYDIFPAVLTMASLYCFITKRYFWAFALLSVATMTKLYPAIIMPIYLISILIDRDIKGALKGIGAFVIAALLIMLPFILSGSDVMSYFLNYHMDRPLQLESLTSSAIALAAILGMTTVWVQFGFGSDNLMGQWPDAVTPFLTPMVVISILVLYAVFAWVLLRSKGSGMDTETNRFSIIGVAIFTAFVIFVVGGKVFSSQYVIWLIPAVLFMMMAFSNDSGMKRVYILFLVMSAITQLCFMINLKMYPGEFNEVGMLLLLVRNIMVVSMVPMAVLHLKRHMEGYKVDIVPEAEHRKL